MFLCLLMNVTVLGPHPLSFFGKKKQAKNSSFFFLIVYYIITISKVYYITGIIGLKETQWLSLKVIQFHLRYENVSAIFNFVQKLLLQTNPMFLPNCNQTSSEKFSGVLLAKVVITKLKFHCWLKQDAKTFKVVGNSYNS